MERNNYQGKHVKWALRQKMGKFTQVKGATEFQMDKGDFLEQSK